MRVILWWAKPTIFRLIHFIVHDESSYVDDSETPEEIMKKFEALEEIQKRKAEASSVVSWMEQGLIVDKS